MLRNWNVTTIIPKRFLWEYLVDLLLRQHSHLSKQLSFHILAIIIFTSHSNTLRIYLVLYICCIHSQIRHITLPTIIRTCPRSVKKVTVLSSPACSTTSNFCLLVLISEFLKINLNISHCSEMREYIQNSNTYCDLCSWL